MNKERVDKPGGRTIRRIVKLLKFVEGKWRIVDYGVPGKVETYIALGYVVKH